MARLTFAGGAGAVVVVATAWLLAAGGVVAGDPPLSPKGLNYEGGCAACGWRWVGWLG